MAADAVVFGRTASGETSSAGRWRIARAGRLVWADALGWDEAPGTALVDRLCKHMRDRFEIAAITNDIHTKKDAEFLTRSGALPAERIMGVVEIARFIVEAGGLRP